MKTLLFCILTAFNGVLWSQTYIDTTTYKKADTTTKIIRVSYDSILPNDEHIYTDSIIIEKIIEKTDELTQLASKHQYEKLIMSLFALIFVIIAIVRKRKTK